MRTANGRTVSGVHRHVAFQVPTAVLWLDLADCCSPRQPADGRVGGAGRWRPGISYDVRAPERARHQWRAITDLLFAFTTADFMGE